MLSFLLIWFLPCVWGCSEFLLNDTHGNIISARTMDFHIDLKTIVEIIPRNTSFQELPIYQCPHCPNYEWKSKYGILAFNMVGANTAADGLNEMGLSAAWLFLEGTKYPLPNAENDTRPIVASLCSYIMGNYASVEEAIEGLKGIQVAEIDTEVMAVLTGVSSPPPHLPLHVALHDRHGESVVIEFVNGQMNIHRNPNGVMTNEPTLDWHLINLEAWVNNIPGDYSSTSRFLRLSKLNHAATIPYFANTTYDIATPIQASVSRALHIINTVVVPPGMSVDAGDKASGATQWTVVRDHLHKVIYFRSTENQVLRRIDLQAIDFGAAQSRSEIPVTYGNWFVDVTQPIADPIEKAKSLDLPPRQVVEKIMEKAKHPPTLQQIHTPFHFGTGIVVGIVLSVGTVAIYSRWTSPYQRL